MSEQLVISIGAELSGFQRAMQEVQKSASELGKKFKGIDGDTFKNVGKNISDVGKKMTVATAPLAAFGALAVKTGADFDAGMSQVKALTGATGHEFDALREQARQLGKDTVFSASEAADAMGYLGMA